MKTIFKIFIGFVSFAMMSGCTDAKLVHAGTYDNNNIGGDEDDYDYPIKSIAPLRNMDRGYHLESNYFAHNLTNPYSSAETYPLGFVDAREEHYTAKNDDITLLQLYLYLTEYVNKDIDQSALDNMQQVFDGLKENGYKAILRFAYNWKGLGTSGGENEQYILRHIEQLKPFLRKNMGQIAVVNIGFLGAWGEWHTTPLDGDLDAKSAIVNALLDAIPDPYSLQIRTPLHKNRLTLTSELDKVRIGYANDYFTNGEHPNASGNDYCPGDAYYTQVTKEAHTFFMVGEIPYDEATEMGLSFKINTTETLKILRDHHYSAFDITQNFNLNIAHWKLVKVFPSLLEKNNIMFDPSYFLNEEGENVSRTYYQFVRDHLGYRLNLASDFVLKVNGNSLEYTLPITNTGFATVLNPKKFYLVFIDANNNVVHKSELADVKPLEWQSSGINDLTYKTLVHKVEGSVNPGLSGKYKVGIWMPDDNGQVQNSSDYAIRFALNGNITHWSDDNEYFVNVIDEVEF